MSKSSKSSKSSKENQKNLEKKLGEVLGLERAAQKAVEELIAMKLLKSDLKDKAKDIQDMAKSHEEKVQNVISQLSEDEEIKLNQDTIKDTAKETEKKASKIMKTYLGEDPDTSEALEFLCLAGGGEVTHYEVLSSISKNFEVKELSSTVNSILKEEQDLLQTCLTLAKENVA